MFRRTITCLVLGTTIGVWPILRIELRPHHHHDDKPTMIVQSPSPFELHRHDHHEDEPLHHQDHDNSRNPVLSVDLHVPPASSQIINTLMDAGAITSPETIHLADCVKPFRFELQVGESPPRPSDSVRTLPLLI
jgi:hypothetical protein